MRLMAAVLLALSFQGAYAEEGTLGLMLGVKAGVYRTSGNLFADKNLSGGGLTLKLIPDDFGKPGEQDAWAGGIGWMLSFDIDKLSGRSQARPHSPFAAEEDIQFAWSVAAVHICSFTQHVAQLCLGLPFSHSLYLEQNLGGESFNSFTMGNKNLPIILNLISSQRPFHFGVHWSSSYWNPTFAGLPTHFNLIQTQLFAGYAF
jgi:hypothetical protein